MYITTTIRANSSLNGQRPIADMHAFCQKCILQFCKTHSFNAGASYNITVQYCNCTIAQVVQSQRADTIHVCSMHTVQCVANFVPFVYAQAVSMTSQARILFVLIEAYVTCANGECSQKPFIAFCCCCFSHTRSTSTME